MLSGGPARNHQIPGIGVGFIPEVLNRSILDEVIAVTDEGAFACARRLACEEGIVAGASAGAAVHAALAVASRKEGWKNDRRDSSRHGRALYYDSAFRLTGNSSWKGLRQSSLRSSS